VFNKKNSSFDIRYSKFPSSRYPVHPQAARTPLLRKRFVVIRSIRGSKKIEIQYSRHPVILSILSLSDDKRRDAASTKKIRIPLKLMPREVGFVLFRWLFFSFTLRQNVFGMGELGVEERKFYLYFRPTALGLICIKCIHPSRAHEF